MAMLVYWRVLSIVCFGFQVYEIVLMISPAKAITTVLGSTLERSLVAEPRASLICVACKGFHLCIDFLQHRLPSN